MCGEGVLQLVKAIGNRIDIEDKIVHQMGKGIDKFGEIAGSLTAEGRSDGVQSVKTLFEWLKDSRFICRDTDTVDLTRGDEVLFQRTDIIVDVTAAAHVFVHAVALIEIADVDTVGIIGIDDQSVGQICGRAPDVGKTEDGNL